MASATHTCLQIGQTLSFALPGPFGPLVAAALQLMDMMDSDDDTNPNQDVLDAIKAQTEELENLLATMKLDDLRVPLKQIGEAVATSSDQVTLATAEGPTTLRTQLRTLLDSELNWLQETNNDAEGALHRLLDVRFPGNNRYELHKTAVGLYLDLLTALICLFKLRCEFQSQWVSLAADEDTGSGVAGPSDTDIAQIYTELNLFWSRLEYWTTDQPNLKTPTLQLKTLNDWVDWIKKDRISLISDVQHQGKDVDRGMLDPTVQTDFFTDAGNRIYSRAHESKSGPTSGGYLSSMPSTVFVSHEAEVKQQHDAYVAAQQQAVKDDLSFVGATIDAIKAQQLQVKSLTPPPQPTAPTVSWADTGWPHAWVGYSGQVRYGVQYVNTNGSSQIAWASWVDAAAAGGQCPHLALPPLPTGRLSCGRVIYRQLKAQTATGPPVLRDSLPIENDSLEYVDLDPADAQGACPSALQPPILSDWLWEEFSPPPPWDKGLPVRYRYRYVNAAGKSLASSPWAIVDPAIGTRSADGFITPMATGSYRPRLRIKRMLSASTVEVYRQIGNARITLSATATPQGRFFVVEDNS